MRLLRAHAYALVRHGLRRVAWLVAAVGDSPVKHRLVHPDALNLLVALDGGLFDSQDGVERVGEASTPYARSG